MDIHKKGWGYENWIVNNELYCGKILHFNKRKRCSLHYHKLKDETFYIQKGEILLEAAYDYKYLHKGDVIRINPGVAHRITAITSADILEISTHHDENDSYRIEKGD